MSTYKHLFYTLCNIMITLSIVITMEEAPLPFLIFLSITGCVTVFLLTEAVVSSLEGK